MFTRYILILLATMILLPSCAPALERQSEGKPSTEYFYIVEPGDTLFSIAKRYSLEVGTLKAANNLKGDYIYPGERLLLATRDDAEDDLSSFQETGAASWYGAKFNGKPTASGEIYNMYAYTAAHPWLPFGTLVRVTRIDNGASVVVRINDRGPFKKNRIIDLSYAAALAIDLVKNGTATVRLTIVGSRRR